MKICRFGENGHERPGLIDDAGRIRDLTGHVADITPDVLAPSHLARLRAIDPQILPQVDADVRLGAPVAGISKIVAVGLNYADHAAESGLPVPEEPIFFMKAVSSLTGPNDDVILPQDSRHSDWEVELGFIVGTKASYVSEADALNHIAGYVLANDVSERFNQKQRGTQWSKGKGHDTFCPLGPWLVTADEVGDPHNLDMFLDVNGQRMQSGNTSTMIFRVPEILSYISRFVTLHPGDLVITGTPPGVGEGKKPNAIFLAAGDTMRLGIEKLGEQEQSVVAWREQEAGR